MPGITRQSVKQLIGTIKIDDLQKLYEMDQRVYLAFAGNNHGLTREFKEMCREQAEVLWKEQDQILDSYLAKGE